MRTIPFSYVIRDIVVVPVVAPALATDQPNSTEHGSVEAELIGRSSHGHALYRGDNYSVYHYPEEATRSIALITSNATMQHLLTPLEATFVWVQQPFGV